MSLLRLRRNLICTDQDGLLENGAEHCVSDPQPIYNADWKFDGFETDENGRTTYPRVLLYARRDCTQYRLLTAGLLERSPLLEAENGGRNHVLPVFIAENEPKEVGFRLRDRSGSLGPCVGAGLTN